MIEFANVTTEYDRERIFRRLHIEPGTHVYDYCVDAFPTLEETVRRDLRMYHCYAISQGEFQVGLPEVDQCAYQVVCLSTCTEEILESIDALLKKGDFLEGYILNDLCNEILFNASNQMNREVDARLRSMGCHLTRRHSPGEGTLAIRYQSELLACFRSEPTLAHITLTDTYMLTPEKSMLYLYGADPALPWIPVEHDCSRCPNTTCMFRSVDAG
ncbi:MAG: hypothetical protein HFG00_06310 [Oscillibacter sp.]|nr:hypothetical protein [Oscillibacter sp.]